jgi:hypothetical protein
MERRQFIKNSVLFFSSTFAAATVFTERTFATKLKLIDMKMLNKKDAVNTAAVGMAKSLNYVEDLAKELKKNPKYKTDRTDNGKKTLAAEQTCFTCQFYKEVDKKTGTCVIFPKVLVDGPGSCTSWTAKS